jgi:hypothetical protein
MNSAKLEDLLSFLQLLTINKRKKKKQKERKSIKYIIIFFFLSFLLITANLMETSGVKLVRLAFDE